MKKALAKEREEIRLEDVQLSLRRRKTMRGGLLVGAVAEIVHFNVESKRIVGRL